MLPSKRWSCIKINDQHKLILNFYELIEFQAQQCESGPAPELFEEEETYWEPAVDTSGLIRQLSSKKYREILRPRLQYKREIYNNL